MAFRHALFVFSPGGVLPQSTLRRVWHPCHTHAALPGGAAVSAAPTEHSCTNIAILPQNPRNSQKLLVEKSLPQISQMHTDG